MEMHRDVVSWLLMRNLALRTILSTLLLSIGNVVLAQSAPGTASVAEDQRILPYTHPGQLTASSGRPDRPLGFPPSGH